MYYRYKDNQIKWQNHKKKYNIFIILWIALLKISQQIRFVN